MCMIFFLSVFGNQANNGHGTNFAAKVAPIGPLLFSLSSLLCPLILFSFLAKLALKCVCLEMKQGKWKTLERKWEIKLFWSVFSWWGERKINGV